MKRRRDPTASARGSKRGKLVGKRVDEAKNKELGPSFADLPSAITSHIMLQLPIKSLLICRCVCRTWKTLISDPHFAKLHFERAPASVMIRTNDPRRVSRTLHLLEYEPEKFLSDEKRAPASVMFSDEEDQFCCCEDDCLKPECNNHVKLEPKFKLPLRDAKLVLDKRDHETKNGSRQRRYIACKPKDDKFNVVNSCNGLLCLCGPWSRDTLVVCNPVTGEFIRLPEASKIDKTQGPIYDFYTGFGFQPTTTEYKVIRLWKRWVGSLRQMVEIVEMHTLGTPTWSNIGVDSTLLIEMLAFPTYLNGALHWIRFDGLRNSILCFNFESERFQTFPSPPGVFEINYGLALNDEKVSMGELSGFLYICELVGSFDDSVIMWVMEKYGIGESWTKVFNINAFLGESRPYGLYWPVKQLKIGSGILMYHSSNCFIYYESGEYGFKLYKVRGTKSKFEVIPHILSLISLKDVVKGDNVKVLNVHSRCAKFKLREENEVLFLAQEIVEVASLYSSLDGEEYGEEYTS